MSEFLNFAVPASVAALLLFVSKPIARAVGAMSIPSDDRWHQSGPTPALGGPFILVALSFYVDRDLAFALAAFCAIGVVDDLYRMRPATKGLLLMAPCALGAWLFDNAWLLPACWIAANAVNLIDHADGLAATTCMVSLLIVGDSLALASAGACFGFLLHNWAPARVFLGDGGSLMLGALLVLAWAESGPVLSVAGLAVPLIDSAFVIIRRIMAGSSPLKGGTDHTGHLFLRMGVSPKLLPLYYGLATGAFVYVGMLIV